MVDGPKAESGRGGGMAPTGDGERVPAAKFTDWVFAAITPFLAVCVLGLASFNLRHLADWDAATERVLGGLGLYWLVIAGTTLSAALYGFILQMRGARISRARAGTADYDRRLVLRFGGAALSAVALGLALVAFRLAQPQARGTAGTGMSDRGIGFFDMMTWLGTFATLVVVISTALVAVWVKRRDDEAQHSAAVVQMRQAWIDKVRGNMAALLAAGQALRAEHEQGRSNHTRGLEARLLMREADLLLNPTEGHHAVLLAAVRSWLHHAGIEDHLRNTGKHPAPLTVATDFNVASDWLVLLTQLVLKIEWAVTSVGRGRVPEKTGSLWGQVLAYEHRYEREIRLISPDALDCRKSRASDLVKAEDG